ncbi:MAG: hypothetical protein R3E44_07025 [Paracoccaceae bacterium]
MTRQYTEDETVAAVARLTRPVLMSYVEAQVVTPMLTDRGPVFRQIDIVRLELLCELSEGFDLDEDALGVVMSLIDQLHGARAELRAVLAAIENEPADVQERLAEAVRRDRLAR